MEEVLPKTHVSTLIPSKRRTAPPPPSFFEERFLKTLLLTLSTFL